MSREAELTSSLEEAWAELERKQQYLQNATDASHQIQAQLDALQLSMQDRELVIDDNERQTLQASLNDAWAELEKKQQFLANSFEEIRVRDVELEQLRAQVAGETDQLKMYKSLLEPAMETALKVAWEDIESRDRQILELTADSAVQSERIEWLMLENKTLSNAIGVDKLRQ